MNDVKGLDTITGLVGEPPPEIEIPFNLLKTEEICRQGWNKCFIAILPYCYKCKVPLIWHSPPDGDNLFTCPDCGRVWVKGDGWNDKAKDNKDTTATGR